MAEPLLAQSAPEPDATIPALIAPGRLLLQKVDGDRLGLLDYEPPGTVLRPGFWYEGRCWVDDDGRHVWFAHDCVEERVATMLPWPTYQVLRNGQVHPSISCDACGLHSSYGIEWTPYGREVVPGWEADRG